MVTQRSDGARRAGEQQPQQRDGWPVWVPEAGQDWRATPVGRYPTPTPSLKPWWPIHSPVFRGRGGLRSAILAISRNFPQFSRNFPAIFPQFPASFWIGPSPTATPPPPSSGCSNPNPVAPAPAPLADYCHDPPPPATRTPKDTETRGVCTALLCPHVNVHTPPVSETGRLGGCLLPTPPSA